MTQVTLPNQNITGANLWSQVEDNDQAIADVVNGDLDATNLADDAVTAAKLRDDASTDANRAVTTNHIRDGAVTAAKVASQAILSGNLKVTAFTANYGSTTWSSSSPSNQVVRSIADVPPGLYWAFGELLSNSVIVLGPDFTTSGGTATVNQVARGDKSSAINGHTTCFAVIQVSATTTVQLSVGKLGASGNVAGEFSLFGITAS